MKPTAYFINTSRGSVVDEPALIKALQEKWIAGAGLDVAPGDIIHMDENGACKFPADRLADVCKNIDALIKSEEEQAKVLRAAKTVEEIKAVLSG